MLEKNIWIEKAISKHVSEWIRNMFLEWKHVSRNEILELKLNFWKQYFRINFYIFKIHSRILILKDNFIPKKRTGILEKYVRVQEANMRDAKAITFY